MPDWVKLSRSREWFTSTSDRNHLFLQKDLLKLYHFTQDVGISHHPQSVMVNLTEGKGCLPMAEGRVNLPRRLIPTCFAHLQRYKAGNTLVFAGPSTWSPQVSPFQGCRRSAW